MINPEDHIGLVTMVTKWYAKRGNQYFNDLYDAGYKGLLQAINVYDERVGVKFSSFASVCIRNAIRNEVVWWRARPYLKNQQTRWLQEEIPDTYQARLTTESILPLLEGLKPKERRVLELKFGFDTGKERTFTELGKMLGMTRQAVQNRVSRTILKIRKATTLIEKMKGRC